MLEPRIGKGAGPVFARGYRRGCHTLLHLCELSLVLGTRHIPISLFGKFWDFFPNVFDPQLGEFVDVKPADTEATCTGHRGLNP